jgi:ribonuclease HII
LEDAKAICEIAESLEGREIIAGIAGGFRDYGRFLKGWELDGKFFRKEGKILRFEVSADKNFGEVALASIFAKYLRELEMKSLSALLGFYETIPYFSGYPSDKKTESLIKTLKSLGLEEFIR